ncbi:uncharacterized protein LOC135218493 [Macrobrachium nipponense]|uniref:uncharacterized protein LOC135218493 n=1 Tax=Macrobrachium nipponense TaxID=159736 RepID=UPI0030C8074B
MALTKNPMKTILITSSVSFVVLSVIAEVTASKSVQQQRSFRSSPMLYIVNGTESLIRENKDGFVYCYSNLRLPGRPSPLAVLWTDPQGKPLLPFSKVDVKKERMFSVQQDFFRPNAYLVFRNFDETLEGLYTCNLLYLGKLVALRSIHLKLFRPTFRVVALPRCLTVRAGGTVLIPSPVTGHPERPPYWRRIGGDDDPSTAVQLPTGLLVQGIQESAVYRAVARLGGGLTHQQDVTLSVILHDGRVKELRSKPRVATSAPSKCLSRPVPGAPLYSSSVVIANDLIADMQMAACCSDPEDGRQK